MTCMGTSAPRSATKSNPPAPTSGSRHSAVNVADLGLEGRHALRSEGTREQAAVDRVHRRVLEDERAWRLLDARLDDLEDVSTTGEEGVALLERPLDVVPAAECEEVVLLVAVERSLLPKPTEDRVRISVDIDVVRVPVDVRGCDDSHSPSFGGTQCHPRCVNSATTRRSQQGGEAVQVVRIETPAVPGAP